MRKFPKRITNVIFCTHKAGIYPRADLTFDKEDGDLVIEIYLFYGDTPTKIKVNRKLARMIAKRINEALDHFYNKKED